MDIVRWPQSFTAREGGVELHQMCSRDVRPRRRPHHLCQDL